jgi:hypothetical protein
VASKVTGLELNADTSNYMVVSRDQNAGRRHSKKADNISFAVAEEFKCMGTILTNQNYIQI